MEVGPRLANSGHAADRPGGSAINQDDTFVALADFRQIFLHDDLLAVEAGEHFQ